jgi:hypothetical protein
MEAERVSSYFRFYNPRALRQSLDCRTPTAIYFGGVNSEAPAFERLLPFAFQGDSMEARSGVKGSLRRAKIARP